LLCKVIRNSRVKRSLHLLERGNFWRHGSRFIIVGICLLSLGLSFTDGTPPRKALNNLFCFDFSSV
jgi:hypothetical protein